MNYDISNQPALDPRTHAARRRRIATLMASIMALVLVAVAPLPTTSDAISVRFTSDRTAVLAELDQPTPVDRVELWRLEPRGERFLEWAVARPGGATLERVVLGDPPEGFVTVQPGGVPLEAFEMEVRVWTDEGQLHRTFILPHLPTTGVGSS